MARTTHSDLAQLLLELSKRLQRVVPTGYLVSDAPTIKLLEDSARILVEQDQRIEEFTVAVRESSDLSLRRLLARK